jgi:hypothetical protein
MAKIEQYSRIINHAISTSGAVFTVPTSNDHTDETWLATDLYVGEFGVNVTDDKVYVRTSNGIIPVATGATGSGTGTQSATRIRVPLRAATGSGIGSASATSVHVAPRAATGSGVGTSLNSILHKNLRTAYGAGGSTTSDTAVGLHIAPRTGTGSGLGTQTALGFRVVLRNATGSGTSTQTATWAKSLIFRTPVEDRFPWSDYRTFNSQNNLFSKAAQGYRARNIFRLTNGTYTNTDPLDPILVERTYYGGHDHFVTQEEKDEFQRLVAEKRAQ